MPSKEEMCVLGSRKNTTQDFLARDMEELVSEIKENLRLSGFKSRPTFLTQKTRVSPYKIPSRSWDSCESCLSPKCRQSCVKKANVATTDPYEMLQELLRDGSLIKEAVRRLQKGLSPKQGYFYDSDEDVRSPLHLCDLELRKH